VKRLTPEDPVLGLAQAIALNFLAMTAALGGLLVFFLLARSAIAIFGGALVFAFLIVAVVQFLRAGSTRGAH